MKFMKKHINTIAIALIFLASPCLAKIASSAQINFTPSMTASEEYNDNVELDPDNETSDNITTVGIGLEGEILWRTAGIQMTYEPSKVWYQDNDEWDYWRHLASGNVWYNLGRNTRVGVRNTYLRTADPTDDSGLVDPDAPLGGSDVESDLNRQGVEKYYNNVTIATLSHQFGARDTVDLEYSYSVLRNINAPPDSDREEHDISDIGTALSYWFSAQWGTELEGSFSNRNLDPSEDREVYDGSGRVLYSFTRNFDGFIGYRQTFTDYEDEIDNTDYTIYQPEIGIRYQFGPNSYARIGLGYFIQNKDSSDNPEIDDSDNQGFILNSEVYREWSFRRGSISLLTLSGYEQDDAGSEDNGLNVYYEGGVDANYALLRRLTANASAGYRWDDYPDQEPSRTDKTFTAGVGIEYQPLTWMTSRLEYEYLDRDSDEEEDEYTQNRVFFSIILTPEQAFRLYP
jgi:opacity protein-like surface antigen